MEKKLEIRDLPHLGSREKQTNKYDYGSVLIIGGSVGFFGAPALSALAAYRTGSGLVTVLVQKKDYPFYHNLTPEVMVRPYENLRDLNDILIKKDAVLFGPGLQGDDSLNEDVLWLLLQKNIPLVIDASGLTTLKRLLDQDRRFENVIVTPHLGEAKRLLDSDEPQKDLERLTQKGMTVVLKGADVWVANEKSTFLADRGNPGMATAGSGDVLAGIIVSYLGQKKLPIEAAQVGVYIHQSAGGLARDEVGEDSLMASDIIRYIPQAIQGVKNKQ